MEIKFSKGHGTGNDFVLVDDFDNTLNLTGEQISLICNRNFGIGSDGIIFIVKTEHSEMSSLLDEEPDCEWFMDYRNADGSKAEMCGNGIRVFTRYLIENNLASIPAGGTLPVATRDGVKDLTATATGFAVDLGLFRISDTALEVQAKGLDVQRPALEVNLGNPHAVVALSSANELENLELTHKPEQSQPRPEGLNYEFVVPADPLITEGVGKIQMRVFERGVGETMSCGTGVAAAALAVRHWSGLGQNHWQVSVPGGELGVKVFPSEEGERVGLSGPAEIVFSGTIEV